MRKILFALYILYTGLPGSAQNIMVLDSITKIPVSYLIIKQDDKGVYTDYNGSASVAAFSKSKPLLLSHQNYYDKQIKFGHLDTILIHPKAIELQEVKISGRSKLIEIKPAKQASNFGSWPLAKGTEIISRVRVQTPGTMLIKSVPIPITNSSEKKQEESNNEWAMIRLNIYELNGETFSKRIFTSMPIRIKSVSKTLVSLDLPNESIEFTSKGLGFGVEMLGYYNEQGQLEAEEPYIRVALTSRINEKANSCTYIRNVLTDECIFSIAEIINRNGLFNISERNLSIGFVLN